LDYLKHRNEKEISMKEMNSSSYYLVNLFYEIW